MFAIATAATTSSPSTAATATALAPTARSFFLSAAFGVRVPLMKTRTPAATTATANTTMTTTPTLDMLDTTDFWALLAYHQPTVSTSEFTMEATSTKATTAPVVSELTTNASPREATPVTPATSNVSMPQRVPTVPGITVTTRVKASVGSKPVEYVGSHTCVLLTTSFVKVEQQADIADARDILHSFGVVFTELDGYLWRDYATHFTKISGTSGVYPLLFVVKKADVDGPTTSTITRPTSTTTTTTTTTTTPATIVTLPGTTTPVVIEPICFSYEQLVWMQYFDESALLPVPEAKALLETAKQKRLEKAMDAAQYKTTTTKTTTVSTN